MAYIVQSDLEAVYGAPTIAKWSSTDSHNSTVVNTARITDAITEAEAEIDDRFRGSRYAVPLSGNTTRVKKWAVAFAVRKLYTPRAQPVDDLQTDPDSSRMNAAVKDALREINLVLMGAIRPGFAVSGTHPGAPYVAGVR